MSARRSYIIVGMVDCECHRTRGGVAAAALMDRGAAQGGDGRAVTGRGECAKQGVVAIHGNQERDVHPDLHGRRVALATVQRSADPGHDS